MDNVAIIDLDPLPYFCLHKKWLKDDKGEFILDENKNRIKEGKTFLDSLHQAEDIIKNTLTKTNSSLIIGAVSTQSFRAKEFIEYKSNRLKEKPEGFKEFNEWLENEYKPIKIEGWEADDIVLSLRSELLKDGKYNPIICCNDKDIFQTPGKHFSIKDMEFKEELSQDKCYYSFWYDMLKGQTGDGISGLKGCGDKGANEILEQYTNETYLMGTLRAYLIKYGEYKGINEFYKTYKMLKLVDTVPLGTIEEIYSRIINFKKEVV